MAESSTTLNLCRLHGIWLHQYPIVVIGTPATIAALAAAGLDKMKIADLLKGERQK